MAAASSSSTEAKPAAPSSAVEEPQNTQKIHSEEKKSDEVKN